MSLSLWLDGLVSPGCHPEHSATAAEETSPSKNQNDVREAWVKEKEQGID